MGRRWKIRYTNKLILTNTVLVLTQKPSKEFFLTFLSSIELILIIYIYLYYLNFILEYFLLGRNVHSDLVLVLKTLEAAVWETAALNFQINSNEATQMEVVRSAMCPPVLQLSAGDFRWETSRLQQVSQRCVMQCVVNQTLPFISKNVAKWSERTAHAHTCIYLYLFAYSLKFF